MTQPTAADELRAAAEKLRALATAASTDSDGTSTAAWHSEDRGHGRSALWGDHLIRNDGRRISWPLLVRGGSPQRPAYMHTQHAAYAAAMHPGVGLALADWLDGAAVDAEQIGADRHALAVARAILGDAR